MTFTSLPVSVDVDAQHVVHEVLEHSSVVSQTVSDGQFVFANSIVLAVQRSLHSRVGK